MCNRYSRGTLLQLASKPPAPAPPAPRLGSATTPSRTWDRASIVTMHGFDVALLALLFAGVRCALAFSASSVVSRASRSWIKHPTLFAASNHQGGSLPPLPHINAAVIVPGFLTGKSDFAALAKTLNDIGIPTVSLKSKGGYPVCV